MFFLQSFEPGEDAEFSIGRNDLTMWLWFADYWRNYYSYVLMIWVWLFVDDLFRAETSDLVFFHQESNGALNRWHACINICSVYESNMAFQQNRTWPVMCLCFSDLNGVWSSLFGHAPEFVRAGIKDKHIERARFITYDIISYYIIWYCIIL